MFLLGQFCLNILENNYGTHVILFPAWGVLFG